MKALTVSVAVSLAILACAPKSPEAQNPAPTQTTTETVAIGEKIDCPTTTVKSRTDSATVAVSSSGITEILQGFPTIRKAAGNIVDMATKPSKEDC